MKNAFIVADFFFVNLLTQQNDRVRLNIAVVGMPEEDKDKLTNDDPAIGFAIVKNNVLNDLQEQVMNTFKAYGMKMDLQVVRFVEFSEETEVAATIPAVDGLFYQVS